jgi:hypothetical protein
MPPLWNYPTRLIFDSIITDSNSGHDTRSISGVIIPSFQDFDGIDKVADNVRLYHYQQVLLIMLIGDGTITISGCLGSTRFPFGVSIG